MQRVVLMHFFFKLFDVRANAIQALVEFCKFAPSKVNLIEYNPIDDGEFQQANSKAIEMYVQVLERNNITVTVRRSRGKDIDAACGQLANKS